MSLAALSVSNKEGPASDRRAFLFSICQQSLSDH